MDSTLQVNLGERSYPIHFGADLSSALGEWVVAQRAAGRKLLIVTDERVQSAQGPALERLAGGAPLLVLPAGETSKQVGTLAQIWDRLATERVDRSGAVVAVGGGVMGDLAGFAAASYLRGVDFVQVPTTLLAMVDSSVGGKTGINLSAGKNLVGAFHQPKAVYVSTGFLRTLPAREYAAGMAEVIKYGLLGDAALAEELTAKPLRAGDPREAAIVARCCAIKARVVEADERETAAEGGRALLNLGHTFGHAIEQVTGYGAYLHGEAVAVGLVAAVRLSQHLGLVTGATVAQVETLVRAHDLPTTLREPLTLDALMAAMARDKKVRAGLPRFVVLTRVGEAVTRSGIEPKWVEAAWREVGVA